MAKKRMAGASVPRPASQRARKMCFVIMPFSPTASCGDWDQIFANFIAPAVNGARCGYACERSEIRGGAFIKDILVSLNTARVVLADLTDMNPNVLYELGVRHTLKHRTILIAQDLKFVPSDLRAYGIIVYSPTIAGLPSFRQAVAERLRQIDEDPSRPDSPVADYLSNRSYMLYERDRVEAIRRLRSLHAEVFDAAGAVGFNLKYFTDKTWQMAGHAGPCIEEILVTQYVNLPFQTYYRLRLFLLALKELDAFSQNANFEPLSWRIRRRQYYAQRSAQILDNAEELRKVIQEKIRSLEDEDYRDEPPQPVMRSAAWEIFKHEEARATGADSKSTNRSQGKRQTTQPNKALQPTSRAGRSGHSTRGARAARG